MDITQQCALHIQSLPSLWIGFAVICTLVAADYTCDTTTTTTMVVVCIS